MYRSGSMVGKSSMSAALLPASRRVTRSTRSPISSVAPMGSAKSSAAPLPVRFISVHLLAGGHCGSGGTGDAVQEGNEGRIGGVGEHIEIGGQTCQPRAERDGVAGVGRGVDDWQAIQARGGQEGVCAEGRGGVAGDTQHADDLLAEPRLVQERVVVAPDQIAAEF